MRYYTEQDLGNCLSQAISATETLNDLDCDVDVIKARLKLLREIADGLGIDIKIPSNRTIMIRRLLKEVSYYD